jgi:sortase A
MMLPALPAEVVEPVAVMISGEMPRLPHAAATAATSRITSHVEATGSPITWLAIPSIDLDSGVVPAPLVQHNGTMTWDVPKFVAGHAEGTPGAGEQGNAIVIGHVTSVTLGNVFEHLDRVRVGDLVRVSRDQQSFDYHVVEVGDVSRSDVSVLEPTSTPTLTLITCSGVWLPTIWDYTQRLVVRAELRP